MPYKELVRRVVKIIEEINPKFRYSKSLGSTLFEMINNQPYYAGHLPKLTSLHKNKRVSELEIMVNHFAFARVNN